MLFSAFSVCVLPSLVWAIDDPPKLIGSFDGIRLANGWNCAAQGWASIVPQFTGPALATKIALANGTILARATANLPRKIAGPHGFSAEFPCTDIMTGFSSVHAFAQTPPPSSSWVELRDSPHCMYYGESWNCSAPLPPVPPGPTPAPVPGQACSLDLPKGTPQTNDCANMNGRFVCNAQGVWTLNASTGQGAFGYCRRYV